MKMLEISKENSFQSIGSHFGVKEEEDMSDMAKYDKPNK